MLSILNLGAAPKVTTAGAQAMETGQTQGQGALASFGALLAQVVAGDGETPEGLDGKLSQLAAMLGKFRAEAQESLSEVFPDGVIVPGPQFNDWARDMLGKLDGMLAQAGFSLTDLTAMLGPVEGLVDGDGGGLLVQAAGTLLGQVAEATGSEGVGGLRLPESVELPDAAQLRAMVAEVEAGEAKAKAGVAPVADVLQAGDPAPLPDALRLLLAQAVAAPADIRLSPEVQAMLSQPQPTVAPLIAGIAAVTPVQAPQPAQQSSPAPSNGFARNLAGQIRGVSFTEGTTRIELTPQGLGKLEIEIAADEAGKLRVVVRAENPAVLTAMRNDRDMLAGLLRDGGASVEDGAMSFEDLGQRRQTAGQEAPGGSLTTASVALDDEDDAAPAAPVVEDGRLNILT